jgi:DNA replication and repair protein RecF
MQIHKIQLQHFRNHTHSEMTWSDDINLILGHNGAGKTNIIDAIHYLCMSRSFAASSDQYVIEHNHSFFKIDGWLSGSIRSEFKVTCSYKRGEGKKIWVNDSPLDRLTDLIGMVPVVVLSPQDRKLTAEGPSERRSFLDSMISQQSKSYFRDLLDYKKVVKQRNAVLSNYGLGESGKDHFLEPWDEQFCRLAARITLKRARILKQFAEFLEEVYQKIASLHLKPRMEYKGAMSISDDDDNEMTEEQLTEIFEKQLKADYKKERDRQYTGVGPHRDDIIFWLDDIELRKYGSQGQHRLFALALKMAELFYLTEMLDDLPIFLLDDVFGDLDPQKVNLLFEMLDEHNGQTFVTAANPDVFETVSDAVKKRIKWYNVEEGIITEKNYVDV